MKNILVHEYNFNNLIVSKLQVVLALVDVSNLNEKTFLKKRISQKKFGKIKLLC